MLANALLLLGDHRAAPGSLPDCSEHRHSEGPPEPRPGRRRVLRAGVLALPEHCPSCSMPRRSGYRVALPAEALGSRYKDKLVGGFGDASCYSFFGNKTITTGEGGVFVTSDEALYERVEGLLSMDPFNTPQCQQDDLAAMGLSADQIQVAMWLEPVKWYGRLLGQTALEARIAGSEMPQARPYQVNTPLNRVVDFIAPESLSARLLGESVSWSDFSSIVVAQDVAHWPQDIRPAIEGLKAFAKALESGEMNEEKALEMYAPHGEYMLAPVYRWLVQDH